MKKILAYTFLSATFLLSGVLENSYTKEDFEKIDNRSGEEIAKNYINEISKNLPTKIDNLTEITNAISINSKMYFRKEFDTKENEKLKNMLLTEKGKKAYIEMQYEKRRKELCENTREKEYMDKKNIGIQDDYYESNTKEYIGSYSIDKSDCIKMEQEQKSKGKYSLY